MKLGCWRLYTTFCSAELYAKFGCLSKARSCFAKQFENHVENNLLTRGNLSSCYKYVNNVLFGSDGIVGLEDKYGYLAISNFDIAALINIYLVMYVSLITELYISISCLI